MADTVLNPNLAPYLPQEATLYAYQLNQNTQHFMTYGANWWTWPASWVMQEPCKNSGDSCNKSIN